MCIRDSGNLYRPLSEKDAQDTLAAAWKAGIRYFDTAPFYGLGIAENRLNPFFRGHKRSDFVVSTKVGRLLEADADRVPDRDRRPQFEIADHQGLLCSDLHPGSDRLRLSGAVDAFGDDVDPEPEALGFLNKFGITYPNGPDMRTKISQMFRIQGVPETYIIDREGRLAYVKKGPFASQAEIKTAIEASLQ